MNAWQCPLFMVVHLRSKRCVRHSGCRGAYRHRAHASYCFCPVCRSASHNSASANAVVVAIADATFIGTRYIAFTRLSQPTWLTRHASFGPAGVHPIKRRIGSRIAKLVRPRYPCAAKNQAETLHARGPCADGREVCQRASNYGARSIVATRRRFASRQASSTGAGNWRHSWRRTNIIGDCVSLARVDRAKRSAPLSVADSAGTESRWVARQTSHACERKRRRFEPQFSHPQLGERGTKILGCKNQ